MTRTPFLSESAIRQRGFNVEVNYQMQEALVAIKVLIKCHIQQLVSHGYWFNKIIQLTTILF
jgi:hypothetical protein